MEKVQESNEQTGSNKRIGCDILADCKQVELILKSQIPTLRLFIFHLFILYGLVNLLSILVKCQNWINTKGLISGTGRILYFNTDRHTSSAIR